MVKSLRSTPVAVAVVSLSTRSIPIHSAAGRWFATPISQHNPLTWSGWITGVARSAWACCISARSSGRQLWCWVAPPVRPARQHQKDGDGRQSIRSSGADDPHQPGTPVWTGSRRGSPR